MKKRRVLFLCSHNSARSQMAEGLLRSLYGDRYDAFSAGTQATFVQPLAIQALKEIGVDISHHRSKSLQEFVGKPFYVVVTVCDSAKEACPFFPGAKKQLHQDFPDPTDVRGTPEERLNAFREARDQLKKWIARTFAPS